MSIYIAKIKTKPRFKPLKESRISDYNLLVIADNYEKTLSQINSEFETYDDTIIQCSLQLLEKDVATMVLTEEMIKELTKIYPIDTKTFN